MKEKDPVINGFVAIASSLGGILFVVILMFLIFAKDQAGLLVPLAWAFVALGAIVSLFAYKTKAPPKR